MGTIKVDRQQILAFRLAAQRLAGRGRPEDILEIAGACGVQDSPPGSAGLALNARIEGLTLQHLEKLLCPDRTLVELWSLRGAPYLALQQKHLLQPDADLHKKIWKISANPGVVLAEGEITAIWRPKKQGDRLEIWVEPLHAPLPAPVLREIEDEAGRMALIRQVHSVIVVHRA